jgi:hypothetical protein
MILLCMCDVWIRCLNDWRIKEENNEKRKNRKKNRVKKKKRGRAQLMEPNTFVPGCNTSRYIFFTFVPIGLYRLNIQYKWGFPTGINRCFSSSETQTSCMKIIAIYFHWNIYIIVKKREYVLIKHSKCTIVKLLMSLRVTKPPTLIFAYLLSL